MYVGRFAPSPTGALHFGSLVAALASYLDARAAGGRWLLRMEDLDRQRSEAGAASEIQRQLDAFGLHWDGEVLWQSRRESSYRAALDALHHQGLVYPCGCSRREIADAVLGVDGARVYPGTCRAGLPAGKRARALRLRSNHEPIRFTDRIQGAVQQDVAAAVGDFVLFRADGLFAYQLAVVVDDAAQGVTDVVRGADLLESTARQIYLQRLLGCRQPRYGHVPVAVNAAGDKLSKQTGTRAIDVARSREHLGAALSFLGHPPPRGLARAELLAWALANWDVARVPRVRTQRAADGAAA